jgi:hypothetical protein
MMGKNVPGGKMKMTKTADVQQMFGAFLKSRRVA